MWVLVVWAVSSAGTYYPHQTLISVSEEACRKEVRIVENMQLQITRSFTFKAECFKSKYG